MVETKRESQKIAISKLTDRRNFKFDALRILNCISMDFKHALSKRVRGLNS